MDFIEAENVFSAHFGTPFDDSGGPTRTLEEELYSHFSWKSDGKDTFRIPH